MIIFLFSLVIFILLDLLWLGVIAKKFYRKHLGYLMSSRVNWAAAIIFYFIYNAGLVFFVISQATDPIHALWTGALFGFVTYATYDLTNHATIKKWPTIVTVVDIVWGAFIGGAVSFVAYLVASVL